MLKTASNERSGWRSRLEIAEFDRAGGEETRRGSPKDGRFAKRTRQSFQAQRVTFLGPFQDVVMRGKTDLRQQEDVGFGLSRELGE